ncbi:MAG: hypothetical protein GAK45_02439 [Pseudomonas citronellolis]|nr:MAG: hypothetical protein GAK45_02439 [Pseudomonas citronellolis]
MVPVATGAAQCVLSHSGGAAPARRARSRRPGAQRAGPGGSPCLAAYRVRRRGRRGPSGHRPGADLRDRLPGHGGAGRRGGHPPRSATRDSPSVRPVPGAVAAGSRAGAGRTGPCVGDDPAPHRLRRLVDATAGRTVAGALPRPLPWRGRGTRAPGLAVRRLRPVAAPMAGGGRGRPATGLLARATGRRAACAGAAVRPPAACRAEPARRATRP